MVKHWWVDKNLPAITVQRHARRGGAVSAFGGGKEVGSAAGRESTDRGPRTGLARELRDSLEARSEVCDFDTRVGAGELEVETSRKHKVWTRDQQDGE